MTYTGDCLAAVITNGTNIFAVMVGELAIVSTDAAVAYLAAGVHVVTTTQPNQLLACSPGSSNTYTVLNTYVEWVATA